MEFTSQPEPPPTPAEPAPSRVPLRQRRWWIALRWISGILLSLALILGIALWSLDTAPGHRFLADRIAALPIRSGLRIRIGRIDGSIWRRATLRDLRLYDPRGLFLEAPEVRLDWHPFAWANNRLDIDRLESPLLILHRAPRLRPSREEKPLLPAFDVRIGRLHVDRLVVGPAVAGVRRAGALTGHAEISRGRARIALAADMANGGDRIRFRLDSVPEQDRFDLAAYVRAPAASVLGGLLGTKRPIALDVDGAGDWHAWNGAARLAISGSPAADLRLAARAGTYALDGFAAPAPFLQGRRNG